MADTLVKKGPEAELFQFDVTNRVGLGRTITAVPGANFVADAGITIANDNAFVNAIPPNDPNIINGVVNGIVGRYIQFWIKGGIDGNIYHIACRATLSDGSIIEPCGLLNVEPC